MAFSEQSLAQARQQGYSDDEIFDHIAKSDERFSVAKQQGYSLDDIASHLKQKEGGVNYEDATSQSGQGPLDNRNEQAISGEVQAESTEGVQADSMLPAEDQSQFRSDEQARVTTGVPQGGELIEGQTKDAQGGIQGQEEGQGLRGQVSTGNEAQVIAPQQAAMQAAPFGAEGVQPTPAKEKGIIDYTGEAFKSAYKGLGTMASELQQFGWDLSKRVNPIVTIAKDAEAVFGQNPFSEKIKKSIVERGDQYFQDLVAGSKLTPEEAQSPLNQFMFGAGHMIGDVALAIATGGESAEARALQSAADLPIWKSITTKSVDGIKSFAAPSLLAANTTIDEERQAGKTETEALAAGMKRLVEMEAGAALPMQVSSGLDNVFLRGASRILQSTPLAVAQGELATAAGNMMASEADRRPTISENIVAGNFEEAAKDLAQVAPMGIMGVAGGRTKQIKDAGLPATAAALEATAKAGVESVPTEIKPAEAPAEAQPTKPSEAKIEEAGGIPPVEGKPVEPETAVKIEEGVAPREGEGEEGQVAPPAAEAAKPEAPSTIEPTKPAEAPAAPQAEPTFIQKAESWADSVIKESSKRVSTGLDPEVLAAYALKGSIVIGRGVRNFGVWSGEMVKQFGEEIRPHLKDIWSRAKSYAEDEAKIQMDTKDYIQRRDEAVAGGGPTVMRGVSERLAEQAGEGTAKEYYIQADELVRRKSLSDVEVMEWTESLTPEQAQAEYERAIFAPASDEKTAAIKVKLAARRLTDLEAAGDDAGYAQVVNEVAREITVAAQVLRDARFLYKATPKGFTTLLEKVAEGKNIKIKPEKIAEIEAQFKDFTEAGKRSEAKELEVLNAKSEEEFNAALNDLEKLRKEGFKKQNALDKTVGGIWPKSGREEIIPTLLKGNLLTTMSVATNLAQNVLKGTFLDVPQKLIQGKYSQVESLLTGKEPKYTFGLEQAVMYYATLAKESPELVRNLFRTALRQPLPADKPVNIMEIRSSLNPMAALRRLKGLYNKEDLQYEGDYGFKEAIKDSLEGTTGVTADIMFDLLTTTDRPFRQAVMISEASGMARKLGLKGLDYEKFVKLPQKGIEKWARENIKDPAKRAVEIKNLKQELDDAVSAGLGESEVTLGGKNVTRGVSNFLNNIAKSNPVSSLLVYANAPYVRFPLNFAVSAFKLANPEVAMVSFLNNAARGNSKKAAVDFSIMASGVVLAYAGKYLYDNGVIQTTDSPQTKAQKLSGELGRAGSINLSKLKRIVNGETSDTMPGDKIQRLDKLGLIGIGILAEADKQEALKKKKLLTGNVSFADALVTRMSQLPVSLAYTLNQTFTKGVAGVVDALTQGEQKMEKLLKNTFSSSLSIVLPNEMSAISRAISDYTPNLNDPKFMNTLENAVRQRFGMTGDLPVKRGFWGEKVTSTPEGANPIAYHFFDFTKQRKLPSVPATMEIIRLFEKTQDNRIIPAEVQDKIAIKGASYRLSAKDHERYQELVGGERLNRVNKLIDSPSYQSASIDRKADRFSKAIDRGARMGERKFLQELQKSGREAGEVLKIPRKELIRRIAELEKED